MLSGTAPDGPTVDKAVMIAKQFGPDVINSVRVLSPQQVMLEVRFVEATRQAGRELGVQWNAFGEQQHRQHRQPDAHQPASGHQRPQLHAAGLRNPAAGLQLGFNSASPASRPGVTRTVERHRDSLPISPIVAAGVLSGTAPFGFMLSQHDRGRRRRPT